MSAGVVTPGYEFVAGEVVTLAKLNALGTPSIAIPAGSITTTELSSGVNASLAAVTSAIKSIAAKSTDFAVLAADKGKLFDVTCGAVDVTATLPTASDAGAAWYIWLRKADTGVGKLLTSIATAPAATGLTKQDQAVLLYSDGANYYIGAAKLASIDVSGNVVLLGALFALGSDATDPAFKKVGSTFAFRTKADDGDASITAKGGVFSGGVRNAACVPLPANDVDWATGNMFYRPVLAGNITITFSNVNEGQVINLLLTQDGTGGRTVAWPTVTWFGGAPTMTATANKSDLFTFMRINGVTYGAYRQNV